MNNNEKNTMPEAKKELLVKLRKSEVVYTLMSLYTRMPYVVCDEETYDDEIYLYFTEQEARQAAESMIKEKNRVRIVQVENKDFLRFYSSLFSIGVNGIVVGKGTSDCAAVQLENLINRPDDSELPKGSVRVENPAFHLTALYLMQEMRKQEKPQMTEELKALNEEMAVHFREAKFIVAINEEKGVVILKQKDGKVFQPVFTDVQEFQKFQSANRDTKFKTAVIETMKLPEVLPKEAEGISINPLGLNLQMHMKKRETTN